MTPNRKDPVLVVLQLSGGNDYLNTVIPYFPAWGTFLRKPWSTAAWT